MTIEKATRLQNELKELFKKYNVSSGTALVVHNETIQVIEAHVTEKHEWVVAITDSLEGAIRELHPNIPVINYNSAQDN